MDTTVIEIADGIYRLSTYLVPRGMVFNQFLSSTRSGWSSTSGTAASFPRFTRRWVA